MMFEPFSKIVIGVLISKISTVEKFSGICVPPVASLKKMNKK